MNAVIFPLYARNRIGREGQGLGHTLLTHRIQNCLQKSSPRHTKGLAAGGVRNVIYGTISSHFIPLHIL